jgi:hypothetical protein
MEIAKWLVIIFIILAIITFFFRWQKSLIKYRYKFRTYAVELKNQWH